MCKMGLFPAEKPKNTYKPKPYEQMTHPGERVQVNVKVVPRKCIADPELRLFQYTAIDEFTRLRFLAAYPEQSTYSSADFLRRLTAWYARRGIKVGCVQTDNGSEFANRFSGSKHDLPTLFDRTAAELGIRHKLIRPYTPWHNGKVERSHREDQKRFATCHSKVRISPWFGGNTDFYWPACMVFRLLDDFSRKVFRREELLPMLQERCDVRLEFYLKLVFRNQDFIDQKMQALFVDCLALEEVIKYLNHGTCDAARFQYSVLFVLIHQNLAPDAADLIGRSCSIAAYVSSMISAFSGWSRPFLKLIRCSFASSSS